MRIRFENIRYFNSSFRSVTCEPVLCERTFHVRNLMSIFLSLGRLSIESVQIKGSVKCFVTIFLATSPTPRTALCRLSAAAYSMYSQLLPPSPNNRWLFPPSASWGSAKGPTWHGMNCKMVRIWMCSEYTDWTDCHTNCDSYINIPLSQTYR
jgi:hypothetical protein